MLEFFDACGVPVLEGYGMTESCAAATLNTPRRLRFGTVGRPLPGTDVAIADDGEVLMRGPHVFDGLPPRRGATREIVATAGCTRATSARSTRTATWHHRAQEGPDHHFERQEHLAREHREHLRETRWISQAVVYGDRRSYLVALLTLDPDEAPKLAEVAGIAVAGAHGRGSARAREIQRRTSTPSTSGSRASSRSSASTSSSTTSPRRPAS